MSPAATIRTWLASSIISQPVLCVTGPGWQAAIDALGRTVDVIHAGPDALARGLSGVYGYGAVVVTAPRLDAASTTGLRSLIHRPAIRILLAREHGPALTGPAARYVAARLRSVHLGRDEDGRLPLVAIRVDRDRIARARDMRELRVVLTPAELPPDAIIRAIDVRDDSAYIVAELPLQLELFAHAQGPPPVGTGLPVLTRNSRQEETENTAIIAHGTGPAVAS